MGCSADAEDRIEHYARCRLVRKFLEAPFPGGAGMHPKYKCVQGFFGLCKGMTEDERIRAATAVHVVGMVVMHSRNAQWGNNSDIVQALRLEWNRVRHF